MKTTIQSLRLWLVLTLLTGAVYPLVVTGIAQVFFPKQTDGSLAFATDSSQPVGSLLLAQGFEQPKYFWPRPSAADYATVASGASNQGPTSTDFVKAVAERREKFGPTAPVDLLTASGSGLDPHLSPAAARCQIGRVAQARGLSDEAVATLVETLTEPPQFRLFGEPRINVLKLNLALDGRP